MIIVDTCEVLSMALKIILTEVFDILHLHPLPSLLIHKMTCLLVSSSTEAM